MLFRTIKQKFIGMSAALMLTLATVFLVVYFLLMPVKTHWELYKTDVSQRHMVLLAMQQTLSSHNLSRFYQLQSQGESAQANTQLKTILSQLSSEIQRYDGLGESNPSESQTLNGLKRIVGQASGITVQGGVEPVERFFSEVSQGLQTLIQANHKVLQDAEGRIDQELVNVLVYLAIFLLAALLMGAFVFTVVSRLITVPLAEMQRLMLRIVAENDLTIRMPNGRKDEVGDTSEAINRMLDRFRMLIRQVLGSSNRLLGEVDTMATISLQTRNSMEGQRSETEMVAASMNEMSATVKTVADNAESAAAAATGAQNEAGEGKSVVDRTIGSINKLAREVQRAADVIHRLESDSESIGVVVDVIRDIAEQTNLLALNAAIEAARAGEQGRGFAVVADEVRTLASRTQESTDEIKKMVEQLQNAARSAVQAMNESRDKANTTVTLSNETGHSLKSISEAVKRITDMNHLIASASEEQIAVSEEINRNVNVINDIAGETASGSKHVASASEQLAHLASELQAQVTQFKL